MTQGFVWRESQRSNISGYTERDAYKAGAQSRQAEIDELQDRIDEALNKLCQLQYASAERVYSDVSKILKGETK